jgi:hypothetical protein
MNNRRETLKQGMTLAGLLASTGLFSPVCVGLQQNRV